MLALTRCPLCRSGGSVLFCSDRRRHYRRCPPCSLVFVPPQYFLDAAGEKAEYDLHRNAVDDPGYRHFLGRLATPLLERVQAPATGMPATGMPATGMPATGMPATGLDFGCGPGPALATMLREAGLEVQVYDCFYAPDTSVLDRSYDFICATEVVEHLHAPGFELERLWSMLNPRGWLGIMTKLVRDREAFATWHYKNDPTHVCFFSRATWDWWADQRGVAVTYCGADVMLIRKGGS